VKEGVVEANTLLDVHGLDAAQSGEVVQETRHGHTWSIWKGLNVKYVPCLINFRKVIKWLSYPAGKVWGNSTKTFWWNVLC